MGHPKFARAKTQTPAHPWKAARIEEEHALKEQFGLKKVGGMREIWREKSALRRHRNQAMKLIGRVDSSEGHFAREKQDLVEALHRRGLIAGGSSIDDVLQITVEHMLARRLQSVVYYRGLAPSMRASRNMIVHGHISIGEQRMTVPGYKILRSEEEFLQYSATSPYLSDTHPFRVEMEQLRLIRQTEEEEIDEVGGVRATAENDEFVQKIKADAKEAPTVKDTIPKGGEA